MPYATDQLISTGRAQKTLKGNENYEKSNKSESMFMNLWFL